MKILFYFLILSFLPHSVWAAKDEAKEFIGKKYILKKPAIYIRNLPWHYTATRNIQWNSPTYYKYDRQLEEVRNACSNCLSGDRLITPIRIDYIPAQTELTVIGTFRRKSEGMSGRNHDFLVVKDKDHHRSELSVIGFSLMMGDEGYDEEEKDAETVANTFSNGQHYQQKAFAGEVNVINGFIEDFKFGNEIQVSKEIDPINKCADVEFKNLTAYMTYRYYQDEWAFEVNYRKKQKVK